MPFAIRGDVTSMGGERETRLELATSSLEEWRSSFSVKSVID
jgi:hypothetical protein